ncbi:MULTISPECIES: hypothetical protein [Bacteria]|uniref:Uncharacterized protein n=1 Tax=Sandarakinorhabdus fusca TaxID=1439888 RepID=A0A7C9GX80_9SPHN|nr:MULTISPECIES: hypothetical protein [Bacteria]KAB7643571.1 hypothetical protein F9290_15935 [Polymorphobacter fuscus]MQT18738.1 hypothetical protein [Polymorphobacter fuscus]
MSVIVEKTAGNRAEISWSPKEDDPRGYLARSIESEQLAYALESLGASEAGPTEPTASEEYAVAMAMHTAALARELERRAAVQVVKLRDHYGLSWRRIAAVLFEDADKQSSVRRMYESGRKHLGR